MEFRYHYQGRSSVNASAGKTDVSFTPDALRKPTYFVGQIQKQLVFREAISALHQVVNSDMRFQPKDRQEYLTWLAGQEETLLAEFIGRRDQAQEKAGALKAELSALNQQNTDLMRPYYKAQDKYFKYLWKYDKDAWWVLDPVITVNPDEIFFECFSEDESSYGKLSCKFDVFEKIDEMACGTTNIDYSQDLYNEFQKIRNYKTTQIKIDPEGFQVATTGEETFEEKKIDLPDSWVRGFLQVSSAMTMPMVQVDLHPMDIHNMCFVLRRHKERVGPRSMRFLLTPDKPVEILFEPWGHKIKCHRSIFKGKEQLEIKVWGRRRLHILERLIPIAKKFTLYLLGNGMPSFYVADLGDMSFTLGLSGWSSNDWSKMGNFDLMAPRKDVDHLTAKLVYNGLRENWVDSSSHLAKRLKLDEQQIKSALAIYSQQGQVLYDLASKKYRIRELSREPLPLDSLQFSNIREEYAQKFIDADLVSLETIEERDACKKISGQVLDNAVKMKAFLILDGDLRLKKANCECHFFVHNQLRKGPCEHILALRITARNRID